jgi:hypothetical protein
VLLAFAYRRHSSLEGRLAITLGEKPVPMRTAFVLSSGGKSFVVVATTEKRDCAWARHPYPFVHEDGQALIKLEIAPVLDPVGTPRWRIASGHASGDGVGIDSNRITPTPVEIRGADPRCPTRIIIGAPDLKPGEYGRGPEKTLLVSGNFTAECCDRDVPLVTSGPMTVRVKNESYPLTRAGARLKTNGDTIILVTRASDPCSDEGPGDDV